MPGTHPNLIRLSGTLAALALVGSLVSCSAQEQTVMTPTASAAPTQQPVSPFESQDAFAWLTAACGSPSVMDASPNSWLPEAQDVRLCLTGPGQPGVLVGVYDDQSASAADLQKLTGQRGYATKQDAEGRTWAFVVETPDPAPLQPLERYGFEVS